MYGLPDRLRPLSAAEEQVMLAVWACREPATRRDIDEKLRSKGWAPATVLNFLYRLEEKGWVKSGKHIEKNPASLVKSAWMGAAVPAVFFISIYRFSAFVTPWPRYRS